MMNQAAITPIPQSQTSKHDWPRLGLRRAALFGLLAVLIGVFLISIALGSVSIPLKDILAVLLGGEASQTSWATIILNFRLPKSLTAVLAGAALAVSGLQMQTFFRNPLAGPFVLGINSGASLGVALVVLSAGTTGSVLLAGLGLVGDISMAAAASIGAGLVLILVLLLARHVQSSMTLLILGLMFGYGASALVSLLLHFSISERIRTYLNWTFGSFGGVTWSQLPVMILAIMLGLGIAVIMIKPLNALLLGETYARSMGLNVPRARLWILTSTAILAGTVTAFCGPIGFIGVAVPHLCRSLFGTSDHRILIPGTILMGALVALVADIIAQVPGSQIILPLNAVTALIGAPVVMWMILRRRDVKETFAS